MILEDNKVDILLDKSTIYCIDNDAVRYIAAYQSSIKFSNSQYKSYLECWTKSVEETERLMKYMFSRRSHPIKEMLLQTAEK